jgi:hypothetical protein
VKKCASCTKDLPEAALHCVFCGAKQPPAPAVQPGLAKTAFGYSNEMMEQLRQPPATAQSPAPPMPPMPRPSPQQMQPMPMPRTTAPSQPPMRTSSPSQPPPIALANAATLFIDNSAPPPMSPQQMPPQQMPPAYAQQTLAAAPNQNPAFQATLAAPPQPQQYPPPLAPMRPSGSSQPPYGGGPVMRSNNPSAPPPILGMPANGYPAMVQPQSQQRQAIAPYDPWRDSLKLVMIVWGLLVIAAIATPISISPLAFSWDVLLHGEGAERIPFLTAAGLGVLGVIVALLPMPTAPRGGLALLLGLAVIAVPIALKGAVPEWHQLVVLVSILLIVPALLMRAQHTQSSLPRIIVTLCVIGFIVPYVVPDHGTIPLVGMFKSLIDAPGQAKVVPILEIVKLALVVMTLLVWMPGPATAGGVMFAWLILIVVGLGKSLVDVAVSVALGDHPLDIVTKTPAELVVWIIPTACVAYVGYGLAAILGRQLE